MRKCKYCGKANDKGSTYCIICGNKLNSTPNFTREQEKAFYDRIIKKYIKRYNLTSSQQNDLNEILNHTNFTNKNFYNKINDIIKDVIVNSLNKKQTVQVTTSKPKETIKPIETQQNSSETVSSDVKPKFNHGYDFSKLKQEFNLKIKKLKKLIVEDFTDSKTTQDYFMGHIDYCEKIFNEKLAIINKIIEFESDDIEFIENQIENNVEALKLIIEKINDLSNEIIASIGSMNKKEIENVLEEMDNLINSVREYE